MAVKGEERVWWGGGVNLTPPSSQRLTVTHPFLSPQPGMSLVKFWATYFCDWSGRGIYTQRGSVKSAHKLQKF